MKKLAILFLFLIPVAFAANVVQTRPYYVYTTNPAIKALVKVRHELPGLFSADLTPTQVAFLRKIGIRVEPVKIYRITRPLTTGKPVCGDGIIHPREECGEPGLECPEGYTCQDCECVAACYPDDQTPWGIEKVYGDPTIVSTSGGAGVKVAVLDTGVDTDHPDLKANLVDCITFVTYFNPDAKSCEDGHGHGTHVSGTILANGGPEAKGIYGVAPEASLMAIKVCDRRGWCFADVIAKGIYYATDQGANIISMSFGGDEADAEIYKAIKYAYANEVLLVAAAGNDGPSEGSIDYPAAHWEVVGVGAIREDESIPDWSSRGINDGDYIIEEKEVEFGAPGVYVESTYNDGCYAYMSGTSMSTPHVSGLAAKLWQGNASSTRDYLHSIAKDIWEPGDDPATGFGLPQLS